MNSLTSTEQAAIQKFAADVHRELAANVVSLSLFGSRSRGEGHEESDLDVLVLLKYVDASIKNQVWDFANDILLETGINIAPLVVLEADFNRLLSRERRVAIEIKRDSLPL